MSYFMQQLAGRWVAGPDLRAAVLACRRANRWGMRGLLNSLGEGYKDLALVERETALYLETLEAIRQEHLRAGLSLKLSSLGLGVGKGSCLRNLLRIVHRAQELGVTVWLDMEGTEQVADTLELYCQAWKQYGNVAVTLQANLERSKQDMEDLLKKKARIRLVKGAYAGDAGDWVEKEAIFEKLMRLLFSKGNHFGIATHDIGLIELAKVLQSRYRREFEFQLLKGVKEQLAERLVREGHQVAQYIPFGRQQLPYVWRRLKEHGLHLFRC